MPRFREGLHRIAQKGEMGGFYRQDAGRMIQNGGKYGELSEDSRLWDRHSIAHKQRDFIKY